MFTKPIRTAIFVQFAIVSFFSNADIPEGYYNTVEGKTGDALKSALHEIIDDHTELNYSAAYHALKILDRDPANPELVIGIYSDFRMDAEKRYDGGQGWNREHVWPKSFGDFGTRNGAGTDLHHLRAADVSTNSNRNNRSFDIGGNIFIDQHGNYKGNTKSKKGTNKWTWEPPENVKGDVARMVLYMAVRYEGGNGEPDLELVEAIQHKSNKRGILGVRSKILKWHEDDPVDSEEIRRNNLIYSDYQKNRNPFIDHPEFVTAIWGSSNSPSDYQISIDAELAEAETTKNIEIGTFNLYWLGTEMRYRKGLRTKRDVHRLADLVVEDLDLEIIAFEEVNTDKNGTFSLDDDERKISSKQFGWLKKRMEQNGYEFLIGSSGDKQRIVIAYDKDEVTLLSDPIELPSPNSSGRLRKPLAANFKAGEFDFWVVAVHLKSKRGGSYSDRIRTRQAEDLLRDIDNLIEETKEEDIILLGDFNAEYSNSSIDLLFHQGSFYAQTRANRRTVDSNEVSYLIGDFASLIDHIMLRPDDTVELIRKSTVIYKPENLDDYIDKYSDHVPVWSSFSTELDAD